jgi:hypothetical protein
MLRELDLEFFTMKLKTCVEYVQPFVNLFGIYFVWIVLFYVCSHIHVYLCVPTTIVGFIMTPFLVPSPHCQALRWVIYNGGNSIVSIWFLAGAWILSYIPPIQRT